MAFNVSHSFRKSIKKKVYGNRKSPQVVKNAKMANFSWTKEIGIHLEANNLSY